MQRHELLPNTPEWLAHRATCFNASDAPAMLGCGLKTRSELLREVHTGLAREVSSYVQERVFDPGHRFEEMARPLAEEIIGEDLGRVVGSLDVGLSKPLGASFDGITFMDDVTFEHKRLNAELRAVFDQIDQGARVADVLPKMFRVQMEQQFMVAEEATRGLFMASEWRGEELVEERHCWYESDPALRAEILAGWKQFDADLAAYVPPSPATVEKIVAEAVEALPSVSVRVEGAIVIHENFDAFEKAARQFLDTRLIREPKTDQDFADLDGQIKAMKGAEAALETAEAGWIAQIDQVSNAKRRKDMLQKLIRDNRLLSEKLLASEKERRRGEIVAGGIKALADHIASLNKRIGKTYMPQVPADFGGCIRGLKSLASMEDKVSVELARAKIAANDVADRIALNLRTLNERADLAFLFPDVAQIVVKATDDLQALVASRIAAHEAKETARVEAERARIRAEEEDKAQREAAQKLAAEQAAARAISQAAAPGAVATAAPAPVSAPVAAPPAPVVARPAPVAADTGERINLGQINERIAPLSITAAGLAALGFEHVATDRASKLYRACDFSRMVAAMTNHLQTLALPA